MSISVAWGGKNSEDKDNIGFFVRKLNIFESFKPSTLTPKRTSSVRAPSGYPQTHGPRCSRQTREKKKRRSGCSGGLYLRCGPGAWILAGLLQPASPSWQQSPCMLPHTWLRVQNYMRLQIHPGMWQAVGLKTYWVLQFLQVTTSTTQEDSHVNLSLSFTPCNRWWCTKGRKCKN